jgi:hypothetical protein
MKDRKIYSLLIIIVIILITGCTQDELQITEHAFGRDLSTGGTIIDEDLEYTFNKYEKNGTIRDLFNYIYFEGDTICFHFRFNRSVNEKDISVWFKNPADNSLYHAERVEIKGSTVYGFSLVGSLLDSFYKNKLNNQIPEKAFCCRKIPFIVKIKFQSKEQFFPASFTIQYR